MRFTIRDLLWLTVVVALVVGWWLERRSTNEARRSAAESREEARILAMGTVTPDREGHFWQAVYALQLKYGVRQPIVHEPEMADETTPEADPPN